MAVNPDPGAASDLRQTAVLDRAADLLRAERPRDFDDVRSRVRGRVSTLVSPAQEFTAYVEAGERGSSVGVSSRVLARLLRDAVDDDQRVVERLELVAGPGASRRRLVEVRLDLSCRYGLDLHRLGHDVRRVVAAVVEEVLGAEPGASPDRGTAIRIVDVVTGDPRLG